MSNKVLYIDTGYSLENLVKAVEWYSIHTKNDNGLPAFLATILKSIRVDKDGKLLTDGYPLHPNCAINKLKIDFELSEEQTQDLRNIGLNPVVLEVKDD